MGRAYNLANRKFGRLTVLDRAKIKASHSYWKCKCECGNEVIVRGRSLVCGETRSCGCLAKERTINASTKHGCYGTRLYRIWITYKGTTKTMKQWSNILNVPYDMLCQRLSRGGDFEKAITTPLQRKNRKVG